MEKTENVAVSWFIQARALDELPLLWNTLGIFR